MKASGIVLWSRAVAVWLLIAAVETLHGVLRALFVAPAIGEAAAQRIGFVVVNCNTVQIESLPRQSVSIETSVVVDDGENAQGASSAG